MLCIVLGIPGVGKTTVLRAVAKKVDVTKFNFGDYMFAEAKRAGLVEDRDDMRKLPKKKQLELQHQAAEKIHKESRAGKVIVDTHSSIKTPTGYIIGLPESILRALNPETIILLEYDPKYIRKRRLKDASRERDVDSIEQIEEHQMMNRCFAAVYANFANATLLIVQNEQGGVDEAAEKIAKVFK